MLPMDFCLCVGNAEQRVILSIANGEELLEQLSLSQEPLPVIEAACIQL